MMENPGDPDVPVLRRPSATLYLMYLLLGGVGTVAASVAVLSNLGGSGGPVVMVGALVLLLGMVSFMGYSVIKLAGALIAKRRS